MASRFKLQTAFCLVFSIICGASVAKADTGYFPYYTGYFPYYEEGRDPYQFATVTPPIQNGAIAPMPASAPPTNWQAPQKNLQDRQAAIMAPTVLLGTRSGLEGGIQASYYRYDEPTPNVQITGPQIGAVADASFVFPTHIFDTFELRYAYGNVDYSSPDGSSKDHANSLWEVRDIVGQDFIWDHYSLSPYLGLGYRNLYNDDRGLTTLGFAGYQRQSQYLYIPIGVKPQVRFDGNNVIRMDAEFDYLAQGWQTSHLGDVGGGDPTIHNSQGSGLGFRGEAMWDTGTWAFGPFINYWNIDSSASKVFTTPNLATCGGTTCVGTEPHNITVEGGVQLKYHFLSF